MKSILKVITTVFLILSCDVAFVMEQKPELVKIKIEDKIYELTLKQAQQSEKLQEILKKDTDLEEPIVLPPSIASEIFDYIYKDLQGIEFDSSLLNDKMIEDLYNAAFDLKISWLQEKYTDITVDRITDITLEVGKEKYHLTAEQAKRSKTLKNTLSDVEDYTVPIPLPDTLENVFEYIYDDLTHKEYDSDVLNIETLVDLVNAANYLDALQLLQRYQNLLIERLTYVDEKNFEEYINLLQKLPEEMQEPLSQLICAKALEVFKKLPQSRIQSISEFNYSYDKMKISPDKKKMILFEGNNIQLLDLEAKKILWKKKFVIDSILFLVKVFFSTDSLKIVLCNGSFFEIINVDDGKELLRKDFASKYLTPYGFFSDSNKVVIVNRAINKLLIIDATTGEVLFELEWLSGSYIKKHYYDPDSQIVGLEMGAEQQFIMVIDMVTGIEIKRKINNKTEKYEISSNAKKIIHLAKEFVSVENSYDDEGKFLWNFKKPSLTIAKVNSFSNDGKLFSVITSEEPQSSTVYVFNNDTGETLWRSQLNDGVSSTFFSPDGQWLIIKTSDSILNINLKLKKEAWVKKYNNLDDIEFISNDMLAFFNEEGLLKFCDIKTGRIIGEINTHFTKKFIAVLKDNLFVASTVVALPQLIAYDILPLRISSFLNQPYIPLGQALLIYYIFKLIENDQQVLIPSDLELIYDELPQEIKKIEKDHNRKFIEDASKESPEALKKFKRRKIE